MKYCLILATAEILAGIITIALQSVFIELQRLQGKRFQVLSP